MLAALVAMYSLTQNVVGTAIITVTLGVRQGSPGSCLLFILFIYGLIMMVKNGVELDDILAWLRIPVVMDDTVLLATTKQNMIQIPHSYRGETSRWRESGRISRTKIKSEK